MLAARAVLAAGSAERIKAVQVPVSPDSSPVIEVQSPSIVLPHAVPF